MEPYLFVLPAVFFVIGILGYGVFSGTLMSLFRVDLRYAETPFVWLDNYRMLLSDGGFQNSFVRTLVFVAGSVGIGFLLALLFSLAIFRCRRSAHFFKALTLVPFLVSGIATAVIFRFLFGGAAGVINHVLDMVGVERILFLAHPDLALLVTILAQVWTIFPLAALLLHAGLLSIDPDLFDAAKVDGASAFYVFLRIMMPIIAPMIGVSLMWLSFASFNVFDITLALTGGGPGRATEVLAVYMYNVGFRQLRYSLGSSVMVIILMLNVVVSMALLRLFKR
ncbi:MAG: sugar ABC transporter permease [Spirochaetaceae bacterium]|nr:MAG: sugar ABC transporter permease [Spirochaetaceae bacterium]